MHQDQPPADLSDLSVGQALEPSDGFSRVRGQQTAGSIHGNRYYIVAKGDVLNGKVWRAGEMVLTKTGRPRSFKSHGLALAFKSANDYGAHFRVAYGWDLNGGLS